MRAEGQSRMCDRPSRFAVGDRVRVLRGPPERHCRTPYYLRGRPGIVEEVVGTFRDPSKLAFHKPGLPLTRLYRVRFCQQDLWPECSSGSKDTLMADLYGHWLQLENEDKG